jgi:lipopolysaccharide biosynthesis glycosyltransferase
MLMMIKNLIPVFFTIDNSYAPYLDCAVRSMVENASKANDYKIIVLYQELSEENMDKIASGVKAPFKIEFVRMKDEVKGITDRVENRLRCDYFTMTIYFRLFIADMFPEYDKGIYIDSDIVVPGDISQMFNIDLKDNIIGACPDHSVVKVPELARYMEMSIGIKKTEYINSGVLLMNLKMMREKEFSQRFLYLLNKYHFDCIAPDQDYINAICNGKILYLDECWDTMPPQGGDSVPVENPKLIHYNLFLKPWCYDNIPYKEYFWKYAEKSPFYQDILNFKKNYSEEKKQSDRECLRVLVEKGGVMDKNDVTFRKIKESGETIRI